MLYIMLFLQHCNAFFYVLIKVSLATLENSTSSFENEVLDLQEKAKLQENLAEQCKTQVTNILKHSNIGFKSISSFEEIMKLLFVTKNLLSWWL